ncbi:DUF4446 family protein [Candidatus Azambacteria bacterium]|nr:DUF4446 family protein [Candidatus Azambacteria bacterium]
MDIQSLETQNILLIILSLLVFVLIIQNIFLRMKYKKIFRQNEGFSMEDVLSSHFSRTDSIEKEIKNIFDKILKIESHSKGLVQSAKIKRYNPFKDSGSDQSFTISLLDGKNNGLLLTGLHSREGIRIYAKPVENGVSQHKLSEEESEILKESFNK